MHMLVTDQSEIHVVGFLFEIAFTNTQAGGMEERREARRRRGGKHAMGE